MSFPNQNGNLTIVQGSTRTQAFQQVRKREDGSLIGPTDCTGARLRFSIKRYGSKKPLYTFTSDSPLMDPAGSHPFNPSLPPLASRIYFSGVDSDGNALTEDQAAAQGKYILFLTSNFTAKLVEDDYLYEIERITPEGVVVQHVLANISIVEQAGTK